MAASGVANSETFKVTTPSDTEIRQQRAIDVGVMLKRRGSATPEHGLDFVSGPVGDERQYPPVLDVASTWDIRIGSQLPHAPRAEYTITVEVAPADERDRAIASAHALHYDASEFSWKNDYRRAHELYGAARDLALKAGDLSIAAESTYQLARMHDQFGDTPAAIEWQLRALELFRQIDQKDRQSRVLNRLGDLSRKVGAVADAERYFALAQPLAEQTRDVVGLADILNNSGLLLLATGRPEEAIERLENALPLAREVNSANVEVALLNNTAEAYRRLGMYDRAIEKARESFPAVARLNLPRRTARSLFMLASHYYENGDLALADETLEKSLDLYRTTEDRLGYAETLGLAARMMYASGDTERALATFAEARPLLQKAQSKGGEASLLTAWADVDIERRDYAAALSKLDDATALSRAIAGRYTETRAEYLRAVAYQRSDRVDEAVAAIRRAIDNVEAMRGSIARSDLRTSYLAAVRSYYDLYVDLLQKRGDAAGAFEVSERARARALLEGLAESAAKIQKGADVALLAKQRAIQRELNAKETYRAEVVQRDGEQSAAAKAVAADVDRLLEQWTAVRAQVRTASPAYAALQQPQPIDLKELQGSLLDARTSMVAYHLGRDRGYVFVIDKDSIAVETLPAMTVIDAVARRYHEALSRELEGLAAAQAAGASTAAAKAGRELAALIWKPIEARVKGRRLLIVADRALHYVPFAALPTSAGTSVLASHEIVYLPSAAVLASLRAGSKRVTLNASTAVFADPVFSKNDPRFAASSDSSGAHSRAGQDGLYARLRFSRREADAIGERAPGAYQALDFAATKSAVVSRDLRKYSVLHFATHGSLNTEHPELSGLVLSLFDKNGKPIDGFLRLHEIYNLDLNADLVVLSACRTALGREVHGEGLIGLTRGFMYAGASRVVSSVWNVDDRASALLMSRFYDAMRVKQLAPAAALRDAQLSLMNDPRWSSPHYWAAFSLQGEWK
ncbi:MAG: CHAT domain-containing protein [Cyanobacteria bacterium]|nr:CHAT domain-containing protein [Cyanobacteriota bacterium]